MLSAVCIPVWGLGGAAGDTVFSRIYGFMSSVAHYNVRTPQENVYLHLDNNAYFLGETLWFKAYVVRASSLLPTDMSRVVYVELVAPDGGIVQRRKLKVENGQAWGDFDLGKVVRSGFYEVRAYTRVMLNWDASYIFSRVVPVFEQPVDKGAYTVHPTFEQRYGLKEKAFYARKAPQRLAQEQTVDSLCMAFYPEGGWLVAGLSSSVAFRLTNQRGAPVDSLCTLCMADGTPVGTFRPQHDGRGVFSLMPDVQGGYVTVGQGSRRVRFPLPEVRPTGYVMTVDNVSQPGETGVLIRGAADAQPELLGLAVTCRGAGVYFDTLRVGTSVQQLHFSHDVFRPGVNQVTLFDRTGAVLSERLIYCAPPDDALHLQLQFDREQYEACSPVKLSMQLKDGSGRGVRGVFSLAVRDMNGELAGRYSTLSEQLLLLSDLKGYIARPSYYFEADDLLHRRHLDLLLMVQGWRRYAWDELAGRRPFEVKHPIEEGLLVDGRVEERWEKRKATGLSMSVIAYTPDGVVMRGECPLDTAGNFYYMLPDFEGNAHGQYATRRKGKLKRYRVVMNRNFEPPVTDYAWGQDSVVPLPKHWLEKKPKQLQAADTVKRPFVRPKHVLPEATVKAKRTQTRLTYGGGEEVGRRYMDREFNMKEEEERMRDDGYITDEVGLTGWFMWRFPNFNPLTNKVGEIYIVWIHNNRFYGLLSQRRDNLSERAKHNFELSRKRQDKGRPVAPDEHLLFDDIAVFDSIRSIMIVQTPDVYKKFVTPVKLRSAGIPLDAMGKLLCVFTYTEPLDTHLSDKGYQQFKMHGYDVPRTCYQPKYGTLDEPSAEDFRRTLYWNPNVYADTLGRASVEFMTNSRKNIRFHVSAQGISGKGEVLDCEE